MKKISDTLIAVIVSFFVTFVFTSALNYVTDDRGAMSISSPIEINDRDYISVELENYGTNMKEKLVLSVPAQTDIKEIITSAPITIMDEISTTVGSKYKYLSISNLEPQRSITLLIPVEKEESMVDLVNSSEIKYSVSHSNNVLLSPLKRAINDSFRQIIVYSLVMGVYFYFIYGPQRDSLKDDINELRDDTRQLNERNDKLLIEYNDLLEKRDKEIEKIRKDSQEQLINI